MRDFKMSFNKNVTVIWDSLGEFPKIFHNLNKFFLKIEYKI